MGVIGRAFGLIRAKSNEWLHGQEKKNAGAIADEAAGQMQKDTAEFTTGAAQAVAQLEAVKDQQKAANAEADKWHAAAVKFKAAGNDKSAKQALEREIAARDLATKLQTQIDAQQARIDNYRQKASDLQNAARDAKNTAEAVKAREKVVSAEEKIRSSDPTASLNKLKEAEADVIARERTQDAVNDMSGSNLEAEANKLQRDSKVDDAFAKLEAEAAAKKAPEAPAPTLMDWNIAG